MTLKALTAAALAAATLSVASAQAAPTLPAQSPGPEDKDTSPAANISGFAHVSADGTLIFGQNVVRVIKLEPGTYEVDFNSKLKKCVFTANITSVATRLIVPEPRAHRIRGVWVAIIDVSGSPQDSDFSLNVTC